MENAENPDFKHIVRLANSDIPGKQKVNYGLTSIRGVGFRMATIIAKEAEVDLKARIGDLSDEDIQNLGEVLEDLQDSSPVWMRNRLKDYDSGEDLHLYSSERDMTLRDDLNRLRKARCYRGIMHETGQKVRGQRSRSNGRSGLSMGVQRKKK
jgi:small subunit ribosomal protein S13